MTALQRIPDYSHSTPGAIGLKAWTMRAEAAAASVAVTAGSGYVVKMKLNDLIASWASIDIGVTVAAVTPTGSHAIGLYDASGVKLTDTADLAAVWNSVGLKTINWQAAQVNIGGPGVYVYLYFLAAAAGTAPSLLGGTTIGGIMNGALTAGYTMWRDNTGVAALPASLTVTGQSGTQLSNGKLFYSGAR